MGLSAIAIGGIVAGIGALAGGAITGGVSARNTRKTNELNYQMWQEQQQYNTQQTDPAYIRERQEAAGYNAALLANGNALGQAASSGNAPQMQTADLSGFGTGLQQAVSAYMAYKQVESDTHLKDAQAEQVHIENQYRTQEAMSRINKMIEDTNSTRVKRQLDEILSRYQDKLFQSQLQQTQEHIDYIKEQTRGQVIENVMSSVRMRAFPEIMRLDIANSAANLAVQKQVERLTAKQVESEAQKIAESIARTGLYNEQAYTQGRQTQLLGEQYEAAKRSNRIGDATEREQIELIKTELIEAVNNSGPDNLWQQLGSVNRVLSGYK